MAVESTLASPGAPPESPPFDLRQAQLKELVIGFFRSQGAPVRQVSDHLVEVDSIPAVADLFDGRDTLRLIFDRERALWYEDCELVAFGNPLLDRILERLTQPEAIFAESFVDFNLGDARPEDLHPRLQFLNCQPTLQLCGAHYLGVLVFRFRVTFLSDEKREELFRVAVNLRTGETDALLLRTLDALPLTSQPIQDGSVTYSPGLLDVADAFRLAQAEALRLVEQASALEQAEANQRLAVDLAILEEYCEREIQRRRSVPARQEEIPEFEAYAAKHRQELIEKYTVRVQVEPLSVQRINFPTFQYRLVVTDCPKPFTVEDLFYDVHRDLVQLPPCPGCGHQVRRWYACAAGHLSCPECTGTCRVCGAHFCTLHATPCRICQGLLCAEHSRRCEVCGEALCPSHQRTCALDGWTVCGRDSNVCRVCQQVFCRSHLRTCRLCHEVICPEHTVICAVCGHPACPTHTIGCAECDTRLCHLCAGLCGVCGAALCPEHLTRCVQCHQPLCSLHRVLCDLCGQPVCPQCVGECVKCGRPVCREHLERCIEGPELVCSRHRQACHHCGGVVCPEHARTCDRCHEGEVYCRSHISSCPVCQKSLCHPHSRLCPDCGNRVCPEHRAQCAGCGLFMCLNCLQACEVCGSRRCQKCLHLCPACQDGRRQCSDHLATCYACRSTVCRIHSGHCVVCGQRFCEHHLHRCTVCGEPVCEAHSSRCSACHRLRCEAHIYHCCAPARAVGAVRRITGWWR